ncbi:poly(rC)-binding protein 3 [Lepeophtheirus salmonis]|uniref:poly(rC)-binding protein 3 n=1 Tax=Lepeophtheirus salmonis TaxID=72036 RepID=UPI001AE1D421|nr:poly(rC)-binding protein 3-like [Lepeophtheirus salmonis]XP_040564732.1 poly(rC)-binding protein 3-like [Lepeophtheirus salmonis]
MSTTTTTTTTSSTSTTHDASSSSSSSSESSSSDKASSLFQHHHHGGTPNVSLTIRMVMNGKEVGSIIGKGGEIINSIREASGAKIHISDGSVPERIVTITGTTEAIYKSFKLICKKFEEDRDPKPPITLRLIVPASQCGSLIGKGGSKIKEMREISGASIQVASEMLPNSTERAVTVSGTKEAITQCILHVCCVMLETPPKGSTIPYHPKTANARNSTPMRDAAQSHPLASLLTPSLMAIASLLRHKAPVDDNNRNTTSFEMSIPNDSIGCIIGKGGSKIAEIRHLSNAMIRISKSSESDSEKERLITITGSPEAVSLAKSLINMALDLHKNDQGAALNLGLLLSKPETLTALTSLASLTSIGGSLLGNLVSNGSPNNGGGNMLVGQVTGAHRSRNSASGGSTSSSSGSRSSRNEDDRGRESKRSKFAPY